MIKKQTIKIVKYVHVITCKRGKLKLKYAVYFYTDDSDSIFNKNSNKVLNKIRQILSKAKDINSYEEKMLSPEEYLKFYNKYERGD